MARAIPKGEGQLDGAGTGIPVQIRRSETIPRILTRYCMVDIVARSAQPMRASARIARALFLRPRESPRNPSEKENALMPTDEVRWTRDLGRPDSPAGHRAHRARRRRGRGCRRAAGRNCRGRRQLNDAQARRHAPRCLARRQVRARTTSTRTGNNGSPELFQSSHQLAFSKLTDMNPDGSFSRSSWRNRLSPNKNATVWQVKVKKGVEFHDGKPLDDLLRDLDVQADSRGYRSHIERGSREHRHDRPHRASRRSTSTR